MSATGKAMRIDRLLSNMGYGTRKDIQTLARAGRITLDGELLGKADTKVVPAPELSGRLRVDGAKLDPLPGMAIAMHKPAGVTCSHKEAGPLVYRLLPPRWLDRKPAISTVGRLDKETTGLLLLTDDGDLLHRIISPKSKVEKRYRVTLARPLRGDESEVLAAGTLMLDGESAPLKPAGFEIATEANEARPVVFVTVTEGRYHQVRRMFAALGNHVDALHRDKIGGLELPGDLAAGDFRVLGEDEIACVFA